MSFQGQKISRRSWFYTLHTVVSGRPVYHLQIDPSPCLATATVLYTVYCSIAVINSSCRLQHWNCGDRMMILSCYLRRTTISNVAAIESSRSMESGKNLTCTWIAHRTFRPHSTLQPDLTTLHRQWLLSDRILLRYSFTSLRECSSLVQQVSMYRGLCSVLVTICLSMC